MGIACYYPCEVSRRITSPFGPRKLSSDGYHDGIDFGREKENEAILAANSGEVVRSYLSTSYGHCIIIDHGGWCTLYAHLDNRLVFNGDIVEAGQIIGIMGATGHSTGIHLHFEVRNTGYDSKFWNKNAAGNCRANAIDPELVLIERTTDQVPPMYQEAWQKAIEAGIEDGIGPNETVTAAKLMKYFDKVGLLDWILTIQKKK